MCLEGEFDIECAGTLTNIKKGDTVLIPASIDTVTLKPKEESLLLEVAVPE